jgi:SAM-dependent methyltransferase
VVCHVADKKSMIADIFRVLKPGGTFLCADFFDASEHPETQHEARNFYTDYVDGMKAYGLSFYFDSQEIYQSALQFAGFPEHQFRDHTRNSARVAAKEQSVLLSERSIAIEHALGPDRFQARVNATNMRLKALESRGLLHAHIQATKPA